MIIIIFPYGNSYTIDTTVSMVTPISGQLQLSRHNARTGHRVSCTGITDEIARALFQPIRIVIRRNVSTHFMQFAIPKLRSWPAH